jgi:hypothetical protein
VQQTSYRFPTDLFFLPLSKLNGKIDMKSAICFELSKVVRIKPLLNFTCERDFSRSFSCIRKYNRVSRVALIAAIAFDLGRE